MLILWRWGSYQNIEVNKFLKGQTENKKQFSTEKYRSLVLEIWNPELTNYNGRSVRHYNGRFLLNPVLLAILSPWE